MRRPAELPTSLSLRFIEQWEQRIWRQKQLIAQLKKKRQSTVEADAQLEKQQEVLAKLRNHAAIMYVLTRPDNSAGPVKAN